MRFLIRRYFSEGVRRLREPMSVVELNEANAVSLAAQASRLILRSKIVGLPTDTIYGIAADATCPQAVHSLYEIKGRDFKKPISLCVSSIDDVYSWSKVTVGREILEDLFPGPVTLLFQRLPSLLQSFNPGANLVGIRIPDHYFIREVSSRVGRPIALTSANGSSLPSSLCVNDFAYLWDKLSKVYDDGPTSDAEAARIGSTIIDLSQQGIFSIQRKGIAYESYIQLLSNKYNLRYQEQII